MHTCATRAGRPWPRAGELIVRRLGFFIILSADGMYAHPDGGLGGFDPADEEHRYANGLVDASGDIVMGRGMYDVMTFWDDLDLDDPKVRDVEREFATFWRETPKHVASRGQPALRANADLIEGDVVDAVRRMKATDGPDISLGAGADLFAELTKARLIDDYRFLIAPMALGRGKAMFGSLEAPLKLRLTNSRTFPSGSVLLEYVPAT
jgi:dihydrofolate reductase